MCEELSKCGVPSVVCEYGLENCLSHIFSARPENLVVVDAVYSDKLGEGDVVLVDLDKVSEYYIPTTHSLPLRMLVDMLVREGAVKRVYIIGVSVKNLDVSLEVSQRVLEAGMTLSKALCDAFKEGKVDEEGRRSGLQD